MKSPFVIYRLLLNGLILSTIFASILFPSPTSASPQDAVSSINQDLIIPGLSETSINAPSAPNAPGAIDAIPDITITDVISVTEGDSGTTDAVFSVILSEAYTQTVFVNYDTEGGTATPGVDYISVSDIVTFSIGITTQLVTVPIQGDYFDELNETFTVTLSNPISGTLGEPFIGLGTIIDDDTAGMSIFPTSGLTTTEIGGTDSFTVALTSQPTATVTIDLSSSDPAEGIASPATLTFTDTNWSIPQTVTVTGVDDLIDDGDIPYTIQVSASSTDSNYNDLLPVDVSVINIDDDIGPEILV
ncbi:MAG: Calx-beta domain-containing protein, partial [Anaerolineales bacterium]